MPTNSPITNSDRWMPDWLKFSFVAAFIFFTCWGASITYWRKPGHNPGTAELVVYLLGLPLALLLMFFVGYKVIAYCKTNETPAVSSAPVKASPPQPQGLAPAILAASLRLPHGASPQELAEAMANDKARADLDKELVDDDGFPILSIRSKEGYDETLQEEIAEWLALSGLAEVSFGEEQWRALTLASAVSNELAGQAVSLFQLQPDNRAILKLIPLLPVEWVAAHRHAAVEWLKHVVKQSGWPADQITVAEDCTNSKNPAFSAIFHASVAKAAGTPAPSIALVIACASYIGDEAVSRWAADSSLLTSSQPRGQIPGEGAAGLLVTDLNSAKAIEGGSFVLLGPVEEARRETSVDESRRTDSTLLESLVERSLKHDDTVFSDVDMVIADTSQRANRTLELMGCVTVTMPQLDGKEDVLRVGVACGTCGAVPFVTALALARHYVLERDGKVLCISNEDPFHRCAVLIHA